MAFPALVVAAALSFSACLGSGREDAPSPSPDGEGTGPLAEALAWGLTDCSFVVAYAPVAPDRLAPYLPPGFSPSPYTAAGPAPLGAALGLEAFRCSEGVGLEGPVPDLQYGSLFSAVVPPDSMRIEGVTNYYVKWDVLIPDDPRREALLRLGVPARDGEVLQDATPAPNGLTVWDATLSMEGFGTVVFSAAIQAETLSSEFSFVEFSETPSGFVAWKGIASGQRIARGYGEIEVPAGSWAEEVIGSTRVATTRVAVGTYSFTNATIGPFPGGL